MTLSGQYLKPDCNAHVKIVDSAKITLPNLMAKNGFIHVIDKVLIPDEGKLNYYSM